MRESKDLHTVSPPTCPHRKIDTMNGDILGLQSDRTKKVIHVLWLFKVRTWVGTWHNRLKPWPARSADAWQFASWLLYFRTSSLLIYL